MSPKRKAATPEEEGDEEPGSGDSPSGSTPSDASGSSGSGSDDDSGSSGDSYPDVSEDGGGEGDDDSGSGEDYKEIVVDFEFFGPQERDFHGLKALLHTYLDGGEYDCSQLVETVIAQARRAPQAPFCISARPPSWSLARCRRGRQAGPTMCDA
jgi:protein BCP1